MYGGLDCDEKPINKLYKLSLAEVYIRMCVWLPYGYLGKVYIYIYQMVSNPVDYVNACNHATVGILRLLHKANQICWGY